ncbi:sugar-phosphatase [uncultured Vagococcus sp.]|uniref:sugar-phosphatase n=1 Tax=uncultured Vagococcus sp. TaxID=189676 RepID=UPI0028D4E044|nr:sugar-phosphatase [uncultured Vagococcus sp.]
MSIKLIAIDIDGTLIDSTHQLHQKNIDTLRKKSAEGVKIVLCSGRPMIGMLPFVEQLGLNVENEYTISYNGALVQHNSDQKTLIEHTLSHADFLKITQLGEKLKLKMHVLDRNHMYTPNRQISEYTVFDAYATQMPLQYCPLDEMPKTSFSKIMFVDKADLLKEAVLQIPAELYDEYTMLHSMPFFFEFLNKEASKGRAIRDLAQRLNIKQEEIMAIGDNENDLDMLTFAGIGVAMANASENAKKAADVITKSNDEQGVAHAIETWA